MNTAPESMHKIRQGNKDSFTKFDCYYSCLCFYFQKNN